MTTTRDESSWDDALRAEFERLAEEPVGRGPDAGELWARAEVVRRLESQSPAVPEATSTLVWGPLVGAVAALLVVLTIGFGTSWAAADASGGALTAALGIVVGSLFVLGLAACSSLALLWNDL